MHPEDIKEYLSVMGFEKLPKLKEVRRRFLELCILTHPDKQGSEEKFKELVKAKQELVKYILNRPTEEKEDEEEEITRRMMKVFSFFHINKKSVTIKYPTKFSERIETVMTRRFGPSDDKSSSKNGNKFTTTSGVFVTSYVKHGEELSTLHVQ